MLTRMLSVSLFFGMLLSSADASVCYVSPDGDDGADGTEGAPLKTLEAAVAQCEAAGGGTVWVKAGDYSVAADIVISTATKVLGLNGRPEDVRVTAPAKVRPFKLNNASALIAGMTIHDVSLNANYAHGGGVYIDVNGGTASNCVFRGCTINGWGASGGGVYLESPDALVTHCVISNNLMIANGGRAHAANVIKGTIRNCLIVRNGDREQHADSAGYSVYAEDGTVESCTIFGSQDYKCAVVYAKNKNKARVVNCILGRGATQILSSAHCADGEKSCFVNCLAPETVNDSCPVGELLVEDAATGRWQPGRDAIDAGQAQDWMSGASDLAGHARVQGTAPDIGCFEKRLRFVSVTPSTVVGAAPLRVAFDVKALSGAEATYVCTWDWDGDGVFGDETSGSTEHEFAVGSWPVKARIADPATQDSFETDTMVIRVLPKTIYVKKGSDAPESPFADPDHAAATIEDALAVAVDGVEIVVSPETYELATCLNIDAAVKVRGSTGDPKDVTLKAAKGRRHFILGHAQATVESMTLQDAAISGNFNRGGSIRIDDAGGRIVNCVFRDNSSKGWDSGSGAVHINSVTGFVDRCVFSGNVCMCNSGGYGGSAVSLTAGTVRNSLFVNNGDQVNYGNAGGSVYATGGRVENCSFYGNKHYKVPGVYAKGAVVVNCIIGAGAGAALDATSDAYFAGTAACFERCVCPIEINNDCPVSSSLFRNAANADWYPGAAALDQAKPLAWMDGALDLAGNARSQGTAPDIGCYEEKASFAKVTANTLSGIAPLKVEYTVEITGTCPQGVTCYWDWDGDGDWDEETAGSTDHEFTAGNYEVRVKVVDNASQDEYEPDAAYSLAVVPKTIFMAPDAPQSAAPYDSWEKAATDLTAAMDIAIDGCEIVVSNGIYGLSGCVEIGHGITIRGLTGRPEDATFTVAKNYRHFILNAEQAELSALTLANGSASGNYESGGSVRIAVGGGRVVNCVIRDSVASGWCSYGGALTMESDKGLVDRCVFKGNYTKDSSGYDGGGTAIYMTGGRVRNCLFVRNGTLDNFGNRGGTVYAIGGRIENCSFYGNRHYSTPGIYARDAAVVNCILAAGTGTKLASPSDVYFSGEASCFDRCLCPVEINGNCLISDELYRKAEQDDFYPGAGAQDLGSPLDWMAEALDLAGNPRNQGDAPDIGCYEVKASFAKVTANRSSGLAPVTVEYAVKVSEACTQGVTCYWDWDGDGDWDEETAGSTDHEFTAGSYEVRVKVVDNASHDEYEPDAPYSLWSVPKTLHVATGVQESGVPFDSWRNAATNLEDAVAFAVDGCEIVVSNGTYGLKSCIELVRGITVRGVSGRPEDVTLEAAASCRHFVLNASGATVTAMTLRGASIGGNYQVGGPVRIDLNGGRLVNCILRDNVARGWDMQGGAVALCSAQGVVDRCVFINNRCDNTSGGWCGNAVYQTAGAVRNCLFVGNGLVSSSFDNKGGTAVAKDGVIENCTFCDNEHRNASGVYADGNAKVVNCLICTNTCTEGQTASCVFSGDSTCFDHCMSDCVKINDSCFMCDATSVFRDYAAGDYRLPSASPAVNAGVYSLWMDGATDLLGSPRKVGKYPDIGCYECQRGGGFMLIVR